MKKLTPVKAIRHKCLECQANRYSLVRNCEERDCSLYRFRLGRNPNRLDVCQKVVTLKVAG